MPHSTALTITYWGTTGTLSAPLLPTEVQEKVVGAVEYLVRHGRLAHLGTSPGLTQEIRTLVEQEVPFPLRSTYGGNTTCVEVETPDAHLVLDCGSGFRELGVSLEARWRAAGAGARREAHVLVTHAHMDHTFSTPFFVPYYNPQNRFTIWGSPVVLESLAAVLNPESRLSQIYFPPTFSMMRGIGEFRPVEPGAEWHFGGTRVRTHALQHPGGCLAYRIDHGGKALVFATDHECAEGTDAALAEFARGADLLYTEGQYTQREYDGLEGIAGDPPAPRSGWGHSPVESCLRTAVAAGVRYLHLGHRDPRRGDMELAALEAYAQRQLLEELAKARLPSESCRTLVPYEGLQVQL